MNISLRGTNNHITFSTILKLRFHIHKYNVKNKPTLCVCLWFIPAKYLFHHVDTLRNFIEQRPLLYKVPGNYHAKSPDCVCFTELFLVDKNTCTSQRTLLCLKAIMNSSESRAGFTRRCCVNIKKRHNSFCATIMK